MDQILQLNIAIEAQREENVRLFSIFQYRSHDKEMQPLIEQWRKGSIRIKALINELNSLKDATKKVSQITKPNNKHFVNGFGEATSRVITTSTYTAACNRMSKRVMTFVS